MSRDVIGVACTVHTITVVNSTGQFFATSLTAKYKGVLEEWRRKLNSVFGLTVDKSGQIAPNQKSG